ncbi:hypothetical protein D3C84_1197400 [compost metagenome]
MQGIALQLVTQFFNQRSRRFRRLQFRHVQAADHQIHLPGYRVVELHGQRMIAGDAALTGPRRKAVLDEHPQLPQRNHCA